MKILVVLCVLSSLGYGSKLPGNFRKCNRKDANFDACVLEAAQNGIPQITRPFKEVNLPNLDPVEVSELKIGAGSQAVAVDQNFKNCHLYGLNTLQLTKFKFNFEEKNIDAAGTIGEIVKKCEYELDGKVLLLPIRGEGPSTVVLRNINVTALLPYHEEKKKGKTYLRFSDTKFTIEPGFVSFNFENLFNGDKALGDNINKVLNENWSDVFADVRGGYEKAIGLVVEGLFNAFFSKISEEDAFD